MTKRKRKKSPPSFSSTLKLNKTSKLEKIITAPPSNVFWRAHQRHTPVSQMQTWWKNQIRRRLQLVPVGLQDGHVSDRVSQFIFNLSIGVYNKFFCICRHPKIITENFSPPSSYFGIIKCKVQPPRKLFPPSCPTDTVANSSFHCAGPALRHSVMCATTVMRRVHWRERRWALFVAEVHGYKVKFIDFILYIFR